jgi:hypothetical protein
MRGAIPPLSQYAFMAWCLVKHINDNTLRLIKIFQIRNEPCAKLVKAEGEHLWLEYLHCRCMWSTYRKMTAWTHKDKRA